MCKNHLFQNYQKRKVSRDHYLELQSLRRRGPDEVLHVCTAPCLITKSWLLSVSTGSYHILYSWEVEGLRGIRQARLPQLYPLISHK